MISQLDGVGRSRSTDRFDPDWTSKLLTSRPGHPDYLGDPDLLGKYDNASDTGGFRTRATRESVFLHRSISFRRITAGFEQVPAA